MTAKAIWNFFIFKGIGKVIKGIGLMTPRRFNIYIKRLSLNTQHKNKLELSAEIIARTKDIQDV